MRHLTRAALAALLAMASMLAVLTVGSTPAGASNAIDLDPNVISAQYWSNPGNCYFRVRYGNFGSTAYAQLRMYNPDCDGSSIGIYWQVGSTETLTTFTDTGGGVTGSDGCGAYREIQVVAPVAAYAVGALAVVGPFNFVPFRHDGSLNPTPVSTC